MKILDVILPLIALVVFLGVLFFQFQEATALVDSFGNLF